MKFNAYFVALRHPQSVFSSTVLVAGQPLPATFRQIAPGLFSMHFVQQLALRRADAVTLRKANGALPLLMPVLSKYNQRKLKKLAQLLQPEAPPTFIAAVQTLLTVEKFLEGERLLPFFSIDAAQAIPELLNLEVERRVKLIDVGQLALVSWPHCLELQHELADMLLASYGRREKTIPLARLERALKVPAESRLFHYLLHQQQEAMPFKIIDGSLVLQKLPLSAEEKTQVADVERLLKKSHLPVFTLEDIMKGGAFTSKQANDAVWNMLDAGTIVRIADRYFIYADELARIINRLKKYKRNQGDTIDINDFRELTALSRRYIIPLFEYLDAQKITQRQDNVRRILLPA